MKFDFMLKYLGLEYILKTKRKKKKKAQLEAPNLGTEWVKSYHKIFGNWFVPPLLYHAPPLFSYMVIQKKKKKMKKKVRALETLNYRSSKVTATETLSTLLLGSTQNQGKETSGREAISWGGGVLVFGFKRSPILFCFRLNILNPWFFLYVRIILTNVWLWLCFHASCFE